MIRLICVGKGTEWDYVRKDTTFTVYFVRSFGGAKTPIQMSESEYAGFTPGQSYDFIADLAPEEEKSPA
jgi:hypothetical protein